MNVLLTGGTGFIGRHVLDLLVRDERVKRIAVTSRNLQKRHESDKVRPHIVDLTNEVDVHGNLFYWERPDVIFHLAANPLVKDVSPAMSRENVLATHHLLEHAPQGVRFVFASSATVYGDKSRRGDWMQETEAPAPTSVYAATKLASEHLVQAYRAAGRLSSYLVLRPAAQVGPGSTHGVLHDFIRKAKSDSPYFDIIGDKPGSSKPFTHVGDTARAFVQLGLKLVEGICNVSIEDYLNTEQLAHLVQESLGTSKPLNWLGESANWSGDNRVVRVSGYRAGVLGWKPDYPSSVLAVQAALQHLKGVTP